MRKAVLNQPHHFVYDPPRPISAGATLTVKFSAGDFSSIFTQSRADVFVSAIANDRRTLTLTASVNTALERDEVRAFLRTSSDTYYAVKLSRLGGTTAILAEPLPREIDLASNATLNCAMHYVDIPQVNMSTAETVPYIIAYEDEVGGKHVETGVFKVCSRPFDTGLNHDELVAQFANLADMVPRRQSDFRPQIKAALDEMALMIRDHVVTDNVTEDEVFNQQAFKLAHAFCAAARIYEMNLQLEVADSMRQRCRELTDSALRTITLDLDNDGVIDDGESNLRRKGGNAGDFAASFSSYVKSENDKFFTPSRGQRH